ncbi:MAG: major outer membrane protein, partial [Sulfurospirillum sp.]|nr:major outer membrane protein [Sulfurospirillum sp.]
MKLAKLSLAAMVVAGLASSSFAADTLADAFKNGKVSGELKAWYFDKSVEDSKGDNNANLTNVGLTLGFVTDSLYGFYAGATYQGSSMPFVSSGDKADTEARFKEHEYASGSVLSEAYLGYKIGKTNAKIGRQYISTPLVSGSGSRFFKESFEGVTVVNTDIPQTTLVAGYVNKFQGRTSYISSNKTAGTEGDAPTFEKSAVFNGADVYDFDGAYTAAIINKSITGLTLTAQYGVFKDVDDAADADVYYTEANYVLPVANFKLGFDVNYRGSRTDTGLDSLNLEGDMFGARVSIKDLAGF